jgi:hypothetical protein
LLQPGVVAGAHAGELGELLPAQAGDPAGVAVGPQSRVRGCDAVTAGLEERPEALQRHGLERRRVGAVSGCPCGVYP